MYFGWCKAHFDQSSQTKIILNFEVILSPTVGQTGFKFVDRLAFLA